MIVGNVVGTGGWWLVVGGWRLVVVVLCFVVICFALLCFVVLSSPSPSSLLFQALLSGGCMTMSHENELAQSRCQVTWE